MHKIASTKENRREVIAERIDPVPPQQLWTKSRLERERKRKAKERNSGQIESIV